MKVIYIRESAFQSIVSDGFTFGCLFLLCFLNHKFLGGSWIIDLTASFFIIIMAFNTANKKVTRLEAIDLLKKLTEEEANAN